MHRTRLLFSKTGRAKYISHLDLMRTFQRVFMRAGVKLRHTEGFNPHPYMNFALPLSVGSESICELLDFDLPDNPDLDALPALLNKTMPEGVKALSAYLPATKFADIAWLEIEGRLIYDNNMSEHHVSDLTALFQEKELIISKKSKKGYIEMDIVPCVDQITFSAIDSQHIQMRAVITAQNPSLNPENLMAAVKKYMSSRAPDFASFRRVEVFDKDHHIFR